MRIIYNYENFTKYLVNDELADKLLQTKYFKSYPDNKFKGKPIMQENVYIIGMLELYLTRDEFETKVLNALNEKTDKPIKDEPAKYDFEKMTKKEIAAEAKKYKVNLDINLRKEELFNKLVEIAK